MSKNKQHKIDKNAPKTGQDILREEAVMSPWRMVWRTFSHMPLGMIGLVVFIGIFILIFGGSQLLKFDPYFAMGVMRNIRPGSGYMNIPSEMLDEGVKDISIGITYSVGTSQEDKYYFWGFDSFGNLEMPEDIAKALEGKPIKQAVAGDRHILVLTEDDEVYGWGNNEFQQTVVPENLKQIAKEEGIKKIGAGDAYSVMLTNKGNIFVWGSTLPNRLNRIPKDLEGMVEDFRVGSVNILCLLNDGSLRLIGSKGSEIDTSMPAELKQPGNDIVSFARTQYSGVVALGNGEIVTWGSSNEKASAYPEMEGKVIQVAAGRLHFSALTDAGKVYSWGINNYKAADYPQVQEGEQLYSGFFNNYVLKDSGHDYQSWGLDGFLLGSDDNGRDLFTRLIHGGKMNLLVAALGSLIQVIIGLTVGLISGYYGGMVDNFLMRFSEIIASFPFYPLIITLAAILPPDFSQYTRMMMIIVILGVLGWTGIARLIRGQIIAEREKDYITAAKALGLRDKKIILAHILPNVMSIIIVNLTLGFAGMLLTEAGLSFLGFGVVEPLPSWGNMMTAAQSADVMQLYWWRWIFPGLAIFITALSVNLIGDSLRDALDPKAMER